MIGSEIEEEKIGGLQEVLDFVKKGQIDWLPQGECLVAMATKSEHEHLMHDVERIDSRIGGLEKTMAEFIKEVRNVLQETQRVAD
eukprot:SAG31_NODE_26_length_32985_cov_39.054096_18_plen_85_part_00